uniref:Putative extracellular serine protease n=1 Tax=uncultured bacterium CBNPD1 BAC clone 2089 TaxID=417311 RepID=B1N6R4_9BACT|nr:putative extracellular serine protease [uncultured bacterium CBNPD1 BAC clone 2089]
MLPAPGNSTRPFALTHNSQFREYPARLGQVGNLTTCTILRTTVVGMHQTEPVSETLRDLALRRLDGARGKTQHFKSPGAGVGERRDRIRGIADEVRDEGCTDRPAPRHRLHEHRAECASGDRFQTFECVNGAEHLLQRIAVRTKDELGGVVFTHQSMNTSRKSVTIDLEAVTKPRLHDSVTALDLEDEALNVGVEVVVDFVEMACDDRAQQHSPKTGRRIGWQNQVAKRNTPSGRDGPRVPDLEFCEQHRRRR